MQQQHPAKGADENSTVMETGAVAVLAEVSPHPPPPPPPPSQRRPRVREVSSRFMSPVISSSASANSSPPFHKTQRSSSVHRPRRQHLDADPLCCSDENRPAESNQNQSFETSPPLDSRCKAAALPSTTQRKQRVVMKLFKENGSGGRPEQLQPSKTYTGKIVHNAFATPSRPDTPTVTANVADKDRMMPTASSRFRRSTSVSATAAAKLLQSSGLSLPAQSSVPLDPSSLTADGNNHDPLINCTARSLPDLRSSMPEADMLPTVSSRLLPEKNCTRDYVTTRRDFSKSSASPCSRSLNLTSSSAEHSLFHSTKGSDKQAYALPKPYTNSVKMGALSLPPVPPCSKPGTDARKERKVYTHQEDVHTLRLLHNRYLQWRFANAKAEASIQVQQTESEVCRSHCLLFPFNLIFLYQFV